MTVKKHYATIIEVVGYSDLLTLLDMAPAFSIAMNAFHNKHRLFIGMT